LFGIGNSHIVGTFRANKKRFAAGLFWQPVGVGYNARGYARTLSRNSKQKSNLFVEYKSMVGLAPRRGGYSMGMPSAAAEIVDALSEYSSFLAVFAVDKKFYLVAVRNGIILADKLFLSESDARTEYTKFAKIPDWSAFIAPDSWGMPRAMEKDLAALLNRRVKYKLRAIVLWRARLFSLILLAAFFAGMYFFFREPLTQMMEKKPVAVEPKVIEEYNRQVDEKSKELDKKFEVRDYKPIVMPYDSLPVPEQRAKQCYQAIGFLMQPITGWVQSNVVCDETKASAEFNRKFGSLDEFYMVAEKLLPGVTVAELDDNTVTVTVALPEVERIASQDANDAETIERNVISLFQSMRTKVKTEIVVDTLTNGVDTAKLNIVEVAVASKLTPMQFTKMFEDYGGVYITRCAWNAISRTWNYEVIIYAK